MEALLLWLSIALCLFSLWALLRHDWLRMTRPRRRVLAQVVEHRMTHDGDGRSYAARYRFHDGAAQQEVTDQVRLNSRRPPVGTVIELVFPEGPPELARPARPLTWCTVYLALFYLLGVLGAKACGFI